LAPRGIGAGMESHVSLSKCLKMPDDSLDINGKISEHCPRALLSNSKVRPGQMVFEHCALHCISIALRTATHLLPAPRSNWISCVEAQHRKCRYERWQLAISRIVRGCHMSRVSVAMFRQDVCCVVLESHPRLRFVIAVSIDVQAIPSRAELSHTGHDAMNPRVY
jgi:hypothetical protein